MATLQNPQRSKSCLKTRKSRFWLLIGRSSELRWILSSGVSLLLLTLVGIGLPRQARSSQPFGLKATLLTTNTIRVTITNADLSLPYEIERTPSLDSSFLSWKLDQYGTPGVTNFTVVMIGDETRGFFRAQPCTDCDGDGIPNWQDADPYNTNVLTLRVTIESPANGSTMY